MEPIDHLVAAWRSRFVIALLTVLGLGGGLLAANLATPTYQARSSVLLAPSASVANDQLGQVSNFMNSQIHSYAELSRSRVVLDPVVEEAGLSYGADRFAEQVSAQVPVNTSFIDISVTDTDPARAALMANSIAARLESAVRDAAPKAGSNAPAVELRTVADAAPPQEPLTPRKALYLTGGAALGLFLGLLLALARYALARAQETDSTGLSDHGAPAPRKGADDAARARPAQNRTERELEEVRS